jgi:hypothetical protein
MIERLGRLDRAAGGLAVDLGLYLGSAIFALVTAAFSTLGPHRGWGQIAVFGYALSAIATLLFRQRRLLVAAGAWVATTWVPLVVLAARHTGQEEVTVVERSGQRLLDTGTPYLGRAAIAALPPDERLLAYVPYQPGMALFGLPRAIVGDAWWADARVWFGLVTAAVLAAALHLLRRVGADSAALVRAAQAATVLPICALTLAVGGDDLPVLALCLLALALAARGSWLGAGLAVGAAGALKLFAWPVALVLVGYAITKRAGPRCALPAFGLPVAVLIPAFAVDPGAAVENVVRLPLGRGLVESPAQSPFPGHLIAIGVPGGRAIAAGLLAAAAIGIGVWLARRPPRDAAQAALVCATGLLAAILLIPATRFGYLLYPAAYALWAPALRVPSPDRVADSALPA